MYEVTNLFSEKVGPDGGLVLVGEFLVDILVHQGGLTNSAVAQDDDLHI